MQPLRLAGTSVSIIRSSIQICPADPSVSRIDGVFDFQGWLVSGTRWRGSGPEFELGWFGLNWRLRLDVPIPGLELSSLTGSKLLSLAGLAVRGRSGRWDLENPVLMKYERLFDRVEASYTLPSWGGLALRASWSFVSGIEAVDLEVQILADSVDYLKGLEVQILTDLEQRATGQPTSIARSYIVEPRDREAAGLSYDGREPDHVLQRLTTLPVPARIGLGFEPELIDTPWIGAGFRYVECIHPEDVSRRVVALDSSNGLTTSRGARLRYGIFGHDLEKGVLLRSRMRGIWRKDEISSEELDRLFREFRETPLPLGS